MTCEDQETVTLPEMCPQSVSLFDDGPLVCWGSSQSGTRAVVNLPTKQKAVGLLLLSRFGFGAKLD